MHCSSENSSSARRRPAAPSAAARGRSRASSTIAARSGSTSPDGTRIVFCSDRDRPGRERLGPGFEIYTMNIDGTGITRITNNRSPDIWPDWQRVP